jgi:Ca2+-transporting ATPase
MSVDNFNIPGLTNEEVLQSRKTYGSNELVYKKENRFWIAVKGFLQEPMILLLLVASAVYFITGNTGDALFLVAALILVSAISLYQDSRSRIALEKLKTFAQPHSQVIRNGEVVRIKSDELVIGDSLMVEEGSVIAADGIIVHSNDFSVNESVLTGESFSVYKDSTNTDNSILRGTTVVSGLAIATVTAVGNATTIGKVGSSLEDIAEEKTPLEVQINDFVKKMVIIGAVVFVIVWGLNYLKSYDLLDSLLNALTLAMSILPEEIPVAFTTFMALGAWRLMKMGVVVKQMKTVETLGSATVICTDKTGTITENRMSLSKVFLLESGKIAELKAGLQKEEKALIRMAMWASEPIPFDPMEIALHQAYQQFQSKDERPHYQMVHEYPIGGKPPMMTHIFRNASGHRIIAAKGAPEAFMDISNLSEQQKHQVESAVHTLAEEGYRVLGVGEALFEGEDYPEKQQQFVFDFKGLVAFYDPPKQNIQSVFQKFEKAGIKLKIVTGDNSKTTLAIARQTGFDGNSRTIEGKELMQKSDGELEALVGEANLFTRMFPEAKMRIINAFKKRNEVVAMTGDGVNDGPALKAAHIGIAMGEKGTEIAKQAANLILLEDDLSKMVDAIAMGRRIYSNLKKAIRYIISIHIPIILMVFIPLALGWIYPNIFTPVHVILFELIMGPTCSIIYENEPMEANTMVQQPRPFTTTFFNGKELTTSILQGVMITLGTLLVYQYSVYHGFSELQTRAMVFSTMISSNIFLTLVNRSFYFSVFTTLRYKNNLVPLIIGVTVLISAALLYIEPLTRFFEMESLSGKQLLVCIAVGFLFVTWFELVKMWKRWRA